MLADSVVHGISQYVEVFSIQRQIMLTPPEICIAVPSSSLPNSNV